MTGDTPWLSQRSFRTVAAAFLLVGLGFAAGNYHVTKEAVDGSGQWWLQHQHTDLKHHLTDQQQKDYDTCDKVLNDYSKELKTE